MILSTCGASAAGFHTTSLFWRAAWARRTSHQEAVVARAVAVPARCKTSRRVSIDISLAFHPAQRQSLHDPALEHEKHEHRGQRAQDGGGHQRPPEEYVLRHKIRQASGKRTSTIGTGEHVSIQKFVPRPRKRE